VEKKKKKKKKKTKNRSFSAQIFTGQCDPSSPFANLKRAVDTQKCIRAGGKHNDLDDVGKDTYHHTFFEMLGNWSFGDYFKKEAIDWAAELLINVYGLPKERMYASYFKGDAEHGIPCDDEARELWLKHLPAERILPFDKKANFWEMGDTGPCGPCTEIHFDLVGGRDAAHLVNADDPTVIEIWNLVFMQFNRNPDRSLTRLPACHVDTGAGLERVTAVLQGVRSNYDTDIFTDIFIAIQAITKAEPYTGKLGAEDIAQKSKDMAYRVVADHIRTLSVAIADGAVPGPEGRGYVLRRIVRRAVRYGTQCLNAPVGFFHQLVPAVAQKLGDVFPELRTRADHVTRIIKREEELFMRTLEKGTRQLNKVLDRLPAGEKVLDGAAAFDLYSTFGFPADLTELMCNERSIVVDKAGYEAAFAAFRVQRDTGGAGGVAAPKLGVHETDKCKNVLKLTPTDDAAKYDVAQRELETKLVAVFDGTSFVDATPTTAGTVVGLLFERTNFYAEAGGQVADFGIVKVGKQAVFDVSDVQSYAGYALHTGTVRAGAAPLAVGSTVHLVRDAENRVRVTANHTSTHMLNWALTQVLGSHVDQKGSKVVAEQFRFDFSNDGAVKPEQLEQVDRLVSKLIDADAPVYYKTVDLTAARKINGLKAVFGEKYPDPVRVVSIGVSPDELLSAPDTEWGSKHSIEFCGGTHMSKTGEARSYATVGESAIAQGIRRVIGVTATEAESAHAAADAFEKLLLVLEAGEPNSVKRLELEDELNNSTLPVWRTAAFRERLGAQAKRSFEASKARSAGADAAATARVAAIVAAWAGNKPAFVAVDVPEIAGSDKAMRTIADALASHGVPALVVSTDADGKKPAVKLFATVPKELVGKLNASEWVKAAAEAFGGRGGGRDFQAQSTHTELSKGAETAAVASKFAASKL
jgi:alanyl-tRNA synthetase